MEQIQTDLKPRIRGNYLLLVFLSTAGVPVALWIFFMLLAVATGAPLFNGGLGFALFMIFVFPVFIAALFSGLAMLITAAVQRGSGIAFLIFLLLGVIFPLIAIIWVGIGVTIARRLYILSLADARHAKSVFPQFYGPLFDDPQAVSKTSATPMVKLATPADHAEALKRLKEMMDLGLITPAEFDTKKAEILSRI